MCTLFAATYPARTRALVLYGTYARGAWAPDYPWAWTDEELEQEIAQAEQGSRGEGEEDHFEAWRHEMVPSLVDDDTLQPFFLKLYSGNLGSSIALVRLEHEVDIRAVLPTIRVPTLVINRTEDRVADLSEGRWLTAQIPGARFVELPGEDHPPWAGDQDAVLDAIRDFLGMERAPHRDQPRARHRPVHRHRRFDRQTG